MKSITALLFLVCSSITLCQDLLKDADALIHERKYNSAFQLLNDTPTDKVTSAIVLKKTEIALEYFAQSIMHRMFAFKDLEPGESIYDVRGSEGSFPMYAFAIDSILQLFINREPKNGNLHKALGDYYYDVQSKYGEDWFFLKPDELRKKMKEHYLEADKLGSRDYRSLHNLGVIVLKEKNLDAAISYFNRSLKLNAKFPSSNYNLSYALLSKGQYGEGLKYARVAFEIYEEPALKADAAQLIGIASEQLGNTKDAISYYSKAHLLNPDNYFYVARLFNLYLKTKAINQSDSLALVLFSYGPHNPNIAKDILDYYYDHELQSNIPRILAAFAKQYSDDDEALGGIFLRLSSYYHQEKENQKALANLDSAKVYFSRCFKPDHYVFGVIDDARKQITSGK